MDKVREAVKESGVDGGKMEWNTYVVGVIMFVGFASLSLTCPASCFLLFQRLFLELCRTLPSFPIQYSW